MNQEQLQQLMGVGPALKIKELTVHMPAGPRAIPLEQICEWNPALCAVAWKTKDGRIHQLHNAIVEVVFEESRIALST